MRLRLAVLVAGMALTAAIAAQHESKEGHAGGSEQAEPDLTVWRWANFAILAAGLGWLAAKNAGPFFASRSLEIRKGIEGAQEMKAEAEARAAEMDRRLASLGAEVESLRKSAREEAAAEAERWRTATETELAKIQLQGEQDIASAGKSARAELRRHAAALALDLAKKKVEDRFTAADQDALVTDFTAHLRNVK